MKRFQPRGGRHLGTQDRPLLQVLYEDDAVVVLNKRAKLLAVPTDDSDAPSALSILSAELKARGKRPLSCIASIVTHPAFCSSQKPGQIEKRSYNSLSCTHRCANISRRFADISAEEGTLVHHFRQEGMFQKVTTEGDPKASRAELRYSVEHSLKGASLVRVSLVTGLQNQIRVQLAAIGHPVIGDRKYNPSEKEERRITRVALHAARLQFLHPRSGEIICIDCEPPPDFQSLLKALGLPMRTPR